jgi:nitroreductase
VIPCIEVEAMPTTNSVSYWASVMGSIMPAVWSFNLALRARGLGTVLTTLHLGYTKEVSDLLGIPDNVMQVGLLPVAYTIGTEFKLAKRLPLDSIVHFDSW